MIAEFEATGVRTRRREDQLGQGTKGYIYEGLRRAEEQT